MFTIYYVVYHDLFFQHMEQLTAKNVNERKMMPSAANEIAIEVFRLRKF